MKNYVTCTLALCALSFVAHASDPAPSMEVFGITMGAPLSIPECDMSGGSYSRLGLPSKSPLPCWRKAHRYAGSVTIVLEKAPLGAVNQLLDGELVGGELATLRVATTGADAQKYHLATLAEKYGPPPGYNVTEMQTRMGVIVPKVVADWAYDDLDVHLEGVGSRVDEGHILITTKPGTQLLDQRRRELLESVPRL